MIEYIIVGVLVSIVAALLSPIIVSKQLSNLSSGMAHGSIGGLSVALFLIPGNNVSILHFLGAAIFVAACSILISRFTESKEQEASVAILFAGALALGPILNSIRSQDFDYTSFLFGNLLLTSYEDLKLLIPLLICSILFLLFFRKQVLYWVFDEHFIYFKNPLYKLIPILFLILTSFTVVIATKVCGIILMTSLLVVPGILSLRFNKSFGVTLLIALLINLSSLFAGFWLSNRFDSPIGASICIFQVVVYLALPRRLKA